MDSKKFLIYQCSHGAHLIFLGPLQYIPFRNCDISYKWQNNFFYKFFFIFRGCYDIFLNFLSSKLTSLAIFDGTAILNSAVLFAFSN